MTMEEGFIQAEPDVRLYFRSVGDGEAVVIPGACWTVEFDVLATGRRVIFYDPRNRGQSAAVELGRISFQADMLDLDAVRRHFGLERTSLIGWSYFGGVVARYAMDFPDAVQRLVMVCGPPIRRLPHSEAVNRLMAERMNAIAPGFLDELKSAENPGTEKLERLWELLQQVRTGHPWGPMRSAPSQYVNERPENIFAVLGRALQTQGDWDWRPDASRVKCPALFVFGTADILPFEAAQEWAECLPNARVLKLEGVGHAPSLESPDRFFPALEDFFRGRWPAPSPATT